MSCLEAPKSKTISAVPESITRADYAALMERFGFVASDISSLRFAADGVYAEVIERDADDAPRVDGDHLALTTVYVPVEG